jgi:hypothetical protein
MLLNKSVSPTFFHGIKEIRAPRKMAFINDFKTAVILGCHFSMLKKTVIPIQKYLIYNAEEITHQIK